MPILRHSLIAAAIFAALIGRSAVAAQQPASGPETSGPHKVVMEMVPSLPNHTIYRPADLTALKGAKLPVLVWGNGGCANAGNAFERYLAEVASQGFIVIANGPIHWAADGRPFPRGVSPIRRPPSEPPAPSSVQQLVQSMDWVEAQARGEYRDVIDAGKIAVAGQSCGGLQAIAAAADPRVSTVLVINSGIIRRVPEGRTMSLPATEADLAKLHTPALYLIGGPTDQAYENARADFAAIGHVPVFEANAETGHDGTYWEPYGGRFAETITAWLKWRLKGDAAAGRAFTGAQCGLCATPGWSVRRKGVQ